MDGTKINTAGYLLSIKTDSQKAELGLKLAVHQLPVSNALRLIGQTLIKERWHEVATNARTLRVDGLILFWMFGVLVCYGFKKPLMNAIRYSLFPDTVIIYIHQCFKTLYLQLFSQLS